MKTTELAPIKESTEDFDTVERRLKELFKRSIYYPLLAELKERKDTIANAYESSLTQALRSGQVTFHRGVFSGRFNAGISLELRKLGARYSRHTATYSILFSELPLEIKESIAVSESRFKDKLEAIDRKLAQILPDEIADKVRVSDAFDRTLWKTDKAFERSVRGITVAPKLTDDERKKIADEWQNNMKLWVQDFTKKEIGELRESVQKAAFAGNRRDSLVKTVQKSYDVSANKAKFLARQETSLLMAKFKETRYRSAGVREYKWGCVAGTKNHPVRPAHKRLEGKVFTWDNPPITTEPGEPARRNNPGQDYNCRCFSKPIVRF